MKAIIFNNLKLFQIGNLPPDLSREKYENKLQMLDVIMETAIKNKVDFVFCAGDFWGSEPSFYALSDTYRRLSSDIPVYINKIYRDTIKPTSNVKQNDNSFLNYDLDSCVLTMNNYVFIPDFEFKIVENRVSYPQIFPCFCGTETGGFLEFNGDVDIKSMVKFHKNPIKILKISARDEEELAEQLSGIEKINGIILTIFNRRLLNKAKSLLGEFWHHKIIIEDVETYEFEPKTVCVSVKDEFINLSISKNSKIVGINALEKNE